MLRCGLLGEKLGHSYSPAIHAELADYEYKLHECAPEDVEAFLTSARALSGVANRQALRKEERRRLFIMVSSEC